MVMVVAMGFGVEVFGVAMGWWRGHGFWFGYVLRGGGGGHGFRFGYVLRGGGGGGGGSRWLR